MNLYNLLPFLNGKKTLIASYGLLIAGIGGVLVALGGCLQHLDVQACFEDVGGAYDSLLAALMGLGLLGVGHKVDKTQS